VIITGVAALGRGNDLAKLRAFIEDIGMLAQINPSAAQLIDVNDLVMRIATSHGIDTEGLIIDKETMAAQQQQEQQQQQQQQMAQQVTQGATPAVASGMMEGIKDGSIDPQALAQGMQGMTGEQ
jgi:flagellar biosynthesis/type III secretory pathway protein FliH